MGLHDDDAEKLSCGCGCGALVEVGGGGSKMCVTLMEKRCFGHGCKIADEQCFSNSEIILMINYDSTEEPKLSLRHFKYLWDSSNATFLRLHLKDHP